MQYRDLDLAAMAADMKVTREANIALLVGNGSYEPAARYFLSQPGR